MGFFAFWLLIMAWVEMSYLSYVNGLSDLAIAEVSRSSKRLNSGYGDHFLDQLNDSNAIWYSLVDKNKFRLSVRHYADLIELFDDAIAEECLPLEDETLATCGQVNNGAIAIYSLSYDFNSLFSYFTTQGIPITREVIVVQEYERDQFQFANQ
ncbi:pilus assembly protein [Ferrimonas pelagia]